MNKQYKYIAHVQKNDNDAEISWNIHELETHLSAVSSNAREFAGTFGNGDWAELSGLWHDLGKFLRDWQIYIRRETGYDIGEYSEGYKERPNHSTAGAALSLERFRQSSPGRILAYIVSGHHAGLPDWFPDEAGGDLSNRLFDTLKNHFKTDELDAIKQIKEAEPFLCARLPKTQPFQHISLSEVHSKEEHLHLWVRMLFSCLVDADFLDTEKFMDHEKFKKRGNYLAFDELLKRFDAYMSEKQKAVTQTLINKARSNILNCCRTKAKLRPGFFSLTVPTGGGKTLSSMAFALNHALAHNKSRIIMAIPYTSIIEQTASVYKEIFGDDVVLEHHSNIDPDKESIKSRLASENWDAPVIVTTNVQLFESLFASRTSSCRKLHSIVNSVIVLDEAQMLPPEYLRPILSTLRGLVEYFGVTVVLCTATQPVLNGTIGSGQAVFEGLPPAIEITDDTNHYFELLNRVDIFLPNLADRATWKKIADELICYRQLLCVVNTRNDCRALYKLMPQGTIHLSANMCGEERSEVIGAIKEKLSRNEEVRVVSTQLIEAGVDIDFPVVYRALAGIDSIAQTAGRCNREGLLNAKGKSGEVKVFLPPKPAPAGFLRKGADAARGIISRHSNLTLSPDIFSSYFEIFYQSVNDFDKPKFRERLLSEAAEGKFQFRTFAKNFRLIDDTVQRAIIVWYKGKLRDSLVLIDQLRRNGPEKWLLRKLQRFIVNVPVPVFEKLASEGYLENIHGYWVQKVRGLYKPGVGLLPDSADWDTQDFIS